MVLNLSDLVHELICRNRDSHGLEGMLEDHPVWPAQSRHQHWPQVRLLRALYKLKLTHYHTFNLASLLWVILHPYGHQHLSWQRSWGYGEWQVRSFISVAVLIHATLQCQAYCWTIGDIIMLCSVLLSSHIWTFVGATASTLKGGRKKGTVHRLREISYLSGTCHSPNQSKHTYLHTFLKWSLI